MKHPGRSRGVLSLAVASTLSLLVVIESCSSDGDRPSPASAAGTASHAAASGGGPAGDAGAQASGGVDPGGANEDAGAAGAAPNGAPAVDPAICSELFAWSSPVAVEGLASVAEQTFLSVTPDELDLAFLRGNALYVAHRANASDRFELLTPVTTPSGYSARHGAALSHDGKRLVLISDPDQKKLAELTRTTRTAPFAVEVDESAFLNVNQDALYTGKLYAAPVVSGRDEQLMFNSSFPGAESTVVVSTRGDDGTWGAPKQLVSSLLDGAPGERRLPSGLSADARTLFYFNEASGSEEVRWRSTTRVNTPLYTLKTLGARRGAAPNSACNRLYSNDHGDVVVETN